MRSVILLLAVAALPLAAQQPQKKPAAKKDTGPGPSYEIPEAHLVGVARNVKTLRVTPKTLTIKVGQTISFNALTVTVIDSADRVRGRLMGYDFSIAPNQPASAVPRQIAGVRPGTAEMIIRYPRTFWRLRTDPRAETKLKIVVTP